MSQPQSWENVRMKTHTPEMRTWESTGTPKTSENDFRGQNTSHWGVLYIIGKLLKFRYLKWARMTHLDIFNTSYGKKKGRESNSATRSRESTRLLCVQVECNTPLESSQRKLKLCFRPHPNLRSKQKVIVPQSGESPNLGNFGTT
jgi:hypothetical protein